MATIKQNVAKLRDRSDVIRDDIARRLDEVAALEARLARYENLPKDDFDNGSIVVFEKRFSSGGVLYTYACVKGGGFWFVSGDTNRRTWEGLLDHIYANIGEGGWVKTYWVTAIEQLA